MLGATIVEVRAPDVGGRRRLNAGAVVAAADDGSRPGPDSEPDGGAGPASEPDSRAGKGVSDGAAV